MYELFNFFIFFLHKLNAPTFSFKLSLHNKMNCKIHANTFKIFSYIELYLIANKNNVSGKRDHRQKKKTLCFNTCVWARILTFSFFTEPHKFSNLPHLELIFSWGNKIVNKLLEWQIRKCYNIGRKGTDSGEGKGVFQIGFQGRSSTILRR